MHLDGYIVVNSDLYETQRWPDRVSLRLYNVSLGPENLTKAARDFLIKNKGFYLGAWSGEHEPPDPLPKCNPDDIFSFFLTTAGRGILHFFTADQLLDRNIQSRIDLPTLDAYLSKYH